MKKILAALLAAATLLPLPVLAAEEETPPAVVAQPVTFSLMVSGKEIDLSDLPLDPYWEGDILMVPLRKIGEALGYEVSWDPETGAITIDDHYIQKATLYNGTAAVSFEGHLKVIDLTHPWENSVPTVIHDGCTYVPLDFFQSFFNDTALEDGVISVSPSMSELC